MFLCFAAGNKSDRVLVKETVLIWRDGRFNESQRSIGGPGGLQCPLRTCSYCGSLPRPNYCS